MKQAHLVAQKHDNHRKDAPPFIVKQRLCWFTSDQSVLWPVLELSTCNILFRIIMVRVVMVRMVRMVMMVMMVMMVRMVMMVMMVMMMMVMRMRMT